MTITLPGRVPSKKNSKRIIFADGQPRLISSEAFLASHDETTLRVRRHRPKKSITRASVAITFFAENRRWFDLTNAAEERDGSARRCQILADDS